MAGNTRNRGFAPMDLAERREIARKGGQAVSRNRDHRAEIGRRGGEMVSRDREHMAAIGERGGEARGRHDGRTAPGRNGSDIRR
jgi:general stress protein YciG